MNGKLEIGRKLLRSVGSAPGFFRMGVIAADFKGAGTVPVVREEWMIAEMRGIREGRQAITRSVGRGSSWQVVGLDLRMRSEMSERVGT